MINTDYLKLQVYPVKDKNDFFKSGIKEATTLRNLCSVCRRMFVVPDTGIKLSVVGESGIYRIDIYDGNIRKSIIGRIYYIPNNRRLDVYDDNGEIPLVAWKSKKCIWKNYSTLLQKVNLENLFLPLVSLI